MPNASGQQIIRGLASKTDGLVEKLKTGGLARYGLDDASLAAINPLLIDCSITHFWHTDPVQRVVSTANPMRLSDTPTVIRRAPPALGQHTHEALRDWLRLSDEQLQSLENQGVIG